MIKGSWLNFKYQTYLFLGINGFKVADVDLATTGDDGYLDQSLRWVTAEGGRRYELVGFVLYGSLYRFSEQDKFLEWNLGRQISVSTEGGEEMFKDIAEFLFSIGLLVNLRIMKTRVMC